MQRLGEELIAGPISTARPAYITITVWATSAWSPRSVRNQNHTDVELVLDAVDELEDLSLDHYDRGSRGLDCNE